jgi:hypothetical protein
MKGMGEVEVESSTGEFRDVKKVKIVTYVSVVWKLLCALVSSTEEKVLVSYFAVINFFRLSFRLLVFPGANLISRDVTFRRGEDDLFYSVLGRSLRN